MPDIFTPPHEKQEDPPEVIQKPEAPTVNTQPQESPKEVQSTETVPSTQQVIEQKAEAAQTAQENIGGNSGNLAKDVLQSPKNPLPLLSHYCEKPTGVSFVNQEDDETIILFVRRHFATNIPWIVFTVFLIFFPILVFALFNLSNFTLFSIPTSLVIILLGFYYLIVSNYALLNFVTWFYDIGIVTKKRLLDLDANNILHHHMAETEIEDVVDVSYVQQGFFQSFFNYGNIHIQTEAIKANFEYDASPQPAHVSDIITDLKNLRGNEGGHHG